LMNYLQSSPTVCTQACIGVADYSTQTPVSTPIPPTVPPLVPGSALGFAYNAPMVLAQLEKSIKNFRGAQNIASAQVDIVAHSMGGDITVTLLSLPAYASYLSYKIGSVATLTSIGTPYAGAPLATQLLQSVNSCAAYRLGRLGGTWSISKASVGGTMVNGAVFDLQSGVGGTNPSTPTAAITSTVDISGTQMSLNTCTLCGANAIRGLCPASPLAQGLTSAGWQGLVGGAGDAIVPQVSQLSGSYPTNLTGLLHSTGLRTLGFTGTAELEDPILVPNAILRFFNSPAVEVPSPFFRVGR